VYTWGRNECGQLGLGDMINRNEPTEVPLFAAVGKAVAASCGRFHTVVVFENGESYTMGSNKHGQCGTGECKSTPQREECHVNPAKVIVPEVTDCKCGAEFTMWIAKDGGLFSAGLPQYGQLGHGTDEEFNAAEFSIKLQYAPQPTPRRIEGALKGRTVVKVACGHNHSVCVDSEGWTYTWGFGGYGRLGHKKQEDEFAPRPIEALMHGHQCDSDSLLACGSTTSLMTTVPTGQVFYCGRIKTTGDSQMYPIDLHSLSGWVLRDLSAGNVTYACCADDKCVTWGQAQYGELGYGPGGKKSSANPDLVPSLSGVKTMRVACGMGHTLFVVHPDTDLTKFPVFKTTATHEEEAAVAKQKEASAKGKKRTASGAVGKASKKGKK